MNRKPRHLNKLWIPAAIVLGASLTAGEFYPIRELAAALIIFSAFFGVVGTGLLGLILIQQVALKGVECIGVRLAHRHGRPALRSPRWN